MKQHIESLPDAVMMIAENGTIIAANSLMQDLLHYSGDELLAKKAKDLAPEESRADYALWRDRLFQVATDEGNSGVKHLHDMRALTKDGTEIALDISLKRYDSEETGPCVIASFRDIAAGKPDDAQEKENEPADPLKQLPDQERFLESLRTCSIQRATRGKVRRGSDHKQRSVPEYRRYAGTRSRRRISSGNGHADFAHQPQTGHHGTACRGRIRRHD